MAFGTIFIWRDMGMIEKILPLNTFLFERFDELASRISDFWHPVRDSFVVLLFKIVRPL
jgi:hypothetical protein